MLVTIIGTTLGYARQTVGCQYMSSLTDWLGASVKILGGTHLFATASGTMDIYVQDRHLLALFPLFISGLFTCFEDSIDRYATLKYSFP